MTDEEVGRYTAAILADRQPGRKTLMWTDRATDRQTVRQLDSQTYSQAGSYTDRWAHRLADIEPGRKTLMWTDRATDRETDRQAGRRTDKPKHAPHRRGKTRYFSFRLK